MKNIAVVLAFLASGICWAQPPADCKPSELNIPGAPYPCVFLIIAPCSAWLRPMRKQ